MELVPDDIHAKCLIIAGARSGCPAGVHQYAKAGVDVPKL
jgi:hypothetical protein